MEANGTPRPPSLHDLVRASDRTEEAIAYHQKHLAAARSQHTIDRERIVAVLRARDGRAFSVPGRVFRPLYNHVRHSSGITDYEVIPFDPAGEIRLDAIEARPDADAALKVAARDFAPLPEPDPEPAFGDEPATARELIRSGRAVEAAELALIDGGEG